jgi:hypothetical protein
MTKKLYHWMRVAIPVLALAFVFGCEQGFEGEGPSNGISVNGAALSVKSGVTIPATLEGTDWLINTDLGAEPYYIVVNFSDDANGNLLGSDISRTTFTYDYENGSGTITTLVGTGRITAISDDELTIDIPGLSGLFTANLIVPTLDTMTDSVWNGETPRYTYASIDFEANDTVQTTFADGTYPVYNLIFYDGVSAGLIEDMGLFYLRYDENDVLTVVFPDFYRYHMGQDVIYYPSALLLKSLNGTVWTTDGGKETVTFTADGADFAGTDTFNAKYVYNNRQAGGVSNGAGSFEIDPTSPLELLFYAFRGSPYTDPPTVFHKQQ